LFTKAKVASTFYTQTAAPK